MKITIFAQSACGGAERISVLYSKILSKDNQVSIHTFGESNVLATFVSGNVKLEYHQAEHATDGFIKRARRIIKDENPDVIFCSLMPLNWRLAIASFGRSCKIILRSDNYIETQSFSQRIRLAFAYRKADKVIAQTKEMRLGLIHKLLLNKKKVITIQNPIDSEYIDKKLNNANPFHGDSIKFVSVGRFAYEKGFDLLIGAYSEVCKIIRNAELYILGDYSYDLSYYKEIQGLIKSYRLEDRVHLIGYTDNPYVYMKNANCFILSSRNEGLPNVLIESLYCGTPAAAFKCIPVIERIIDNGNTGFLAEKEDIMGLSTAMINCVKLGRIKTSYDSDVADKVIGAFDSVI